MWKGCYIMKWFYNMRIATKLILGFIIVAIIAGAIGGTGIFAIRRVENSYEVSSKDTASALQYTEEISSYFQRLRMNLYALVLAQDEVNKSFYLGRMDELKETIDENIENYRLMLSTYEAGEVEREIELIDSLQTKLMAFGSLRDQFANGIALDPGRRDEAYEEYLQDGGDLRTLGLAVDEAILDLIEYNIEYTGATIASNSALAAMSVTIMVIGIVVGVILAILIGILIARVLSKPINEMVEVAEKLALGDVNVDIQVDSQDEIGNLAASFRRMIENIRGQALVAEQIAAGDLTVEVPIRSEEDILGKKLAEIVEINNEVLGNIVSSSEQVAAGSKQVSDSSIALSQGAAEQASSIEELTASIEEISSQTNLNADNAREANNLADEAKTHATEGNREMGQMLRAMEEINESSSNISKIIKVIDEIAFQTNILALNAAVEAARAGQHGKGFAVVAEEVRNLAARSADAARETTEMIEGSIKKTEDGTKIARDTAEALGEIVTDIERVADLVSNIAVASDEQARGIGQINEGIMQVSQVVQTNSATSEESAAASEELSGQAALLQEMVGKFKLKQATRSLSNIRGNHEDMMENFSLTPQRLDYESKDKNNGKDNEDFIQEVKSPLSDSEFGKY